MVLRSLPIRHLKERTDLNGMKQTDPAPLFATNASQSEAMQAQGNCGPLDTPIPAQESMRSKVLELRRAIEAGTYYVSSAQLADCLLERLNQPKTD